MRIDSPAFSLANNNDSKSPRFAIKIATDQEGLDYHVFTSHKDGALPDGVVASGDPLTLNQLQTIVLPSPAAWDYLGGSVSFSNNGNTLLMVGAAFDGSGDNNIGRVKIANKNVDGTYTINHTLLAADTTIDDHFGLTAHTAGNGIYALVGAPKEATTVSDGGALYIFKWNGSTWVEHKRLEPIGLAANDQFSWKGEISEDGMTVLATSPFSLSNIPTELYTEANALGLLGTEANATSNVTVKGTTVVTAVTSETNDSNYALSIDSDSSPQDGNGAYIDLFDYASDGDTITVRHDIKHFGTAGGGWFAGTSSDGNTPVGNSLVINPAHDSYGDVVYEETFVLSSSTRYFVWLEVNVNNSSGVYVDNFSVTVEATNGGAAWIFETTDDWATYTETRLNPSDPSDDLYYGYGGHLSPDGKVAFIGARTSDDTGKLYIHVKGGSWDITEAQSVVAYDGATGEGFAASSSGYPNLFCGTVITSSNDGAHLMVGAKLALDPAGVANGAVYYLKRNNDGVWVFVQKIVPPSGNGTFYWFGYKLDMTRTGHRAVIGSQGEHTDSLNDVGAYYVLSLGNDGKYQILERVQPNDPDEWEYSGFSVAIDSGGKMIASGSTDYTDTASSQGCVRVYETSKNVGFMGWLKAVSGTSQSVNPLQAASSIGNLFYTILDKNKEVTALLSRKWQNGDSLRHRLVEVYAGYEGLEWSEYSQIVAQIHNKIEYQGGQYKGSCSDIQREVNKTIFILKRTRLAVSLVGDIVSTDLTFDSADSSVNSLATDFGEYTSNHVGHKITFSGTASNDGSFTIATVAPNKITFAEAITDESLTTSAIMRHVTVQITSATNPFEAVVHGPEYQRDSPNLTVGYVRINDEIVRWNPTDGFSEVQRGAFSTKPVTHEVTPEDIDDRKPEVVEFPYLEGPTIKLAYNILTGYDPGGTVKVIPDHWSLLIDQSLVNEDTFTNIGVDIWDTADNDNGLVFVFDDLEDEDGAKFIQEQLLLPSGCFPRIAGDGRYGIKRFLSTLPDATPSYQLDETNITDVSALVHNYDTVRNIFRVDWNRDFVSGKYTRKSLLIDQTSIDINKFARSIKIQLRGVHGSRHTEELLYKIFNFLRDRYSFHSMGLSVQTKFTANPMDVGDIAGINTKMIQDFVGGGDIDRSMEVQNKSVDWVGGRVNYRMFGSSNPSGPLVRGSSTSVIDDEWFTSRGSSLNPAPSTVGSQITVSVNGDLLTITGSGQLDGVDDINSATAVTDNDQGIFFWDGDIVVAEGVDVTCTKNVMICYTGVFTNLGNITFEGQGLEASTYGQAGQVGRTEAMGGMHVSRQGLSFADIASNRAVAAAPPAPQPSAVEGVWPDGLPSDINIQWDGTNLLGIPSSLMGCSGGTGGAVTSSGTLSAAAGAGAKSGGGFYLCGRGYSGSTGSVVNTSGAASSLGSTSVGSPEGRLGTFFFVGGSGAPGHNGGWLLMMDGIGAIDNNALSSFEARIGQMPMLGVRPPSANSNAIELPPSSTVHSFYEGLSDTRNRALSFFKKIIIDDISNPQEDQNPNIVAAPAITTLVSNEDALLIQPSGELVPRIQINWTPDTDDLLITHFEVEYKEVTETLYTPMPNVIGRLANRTHVHPVIAGETYVVRIRSINSHGNSSDWVYSAQHLVVGQSAEPPDVPSFLVSRQSDGTRQFTWSYPTPPSDVAIGGGFIIKYVAGAGGTWATMSELPGAERLPPGIRRWESNQLSAGLYTFGIKAVDSTGNESVNAMIIEQTLGDPRLADAFENISLPEDGWSGTKTNCWVDEYGQLVASDQDDWTDRATWAAWTPEFASNPFLSITYQHGTIDLGGIVTFTPEATIVHNGATLTVEEQHSDDDTTYSSWATAGAPVTARYIRIRFTFTIVSGTIVVQNGDIVLSGDPVSELIEDLDTSTIATVAGDFRIPIVNSYTVIRKSNITALQQVTGGWSSALIDKGNIDADGLRWLANTAYSVGDQIYPDANDNGHYYQCTTAGTSGATEPASWPTSGTQVDNTVTWTEYGLQGPRHKIYNATPVLADATIDAEITGL